MRWCASWDRERLLQTAGVHVGDVITSFNGEEISDEIDFERKLEQTEPGDEFELAVNRDGKAVALSGTLVRRPMQVIRPEVRADGGIDPLSFLLTLNSIDDKRIADDEEELPGCKNAHEQLASLAQADPDELVFQYELPEYQLTVLKRFRLAKVDPADAENPTAPAYHLSFAIEVPKQRVQSAQSRLAARGAHPVCRWKEPGTPPRSARDGFARPACAT